MDERPPRRRAPQRTLKQRAVALLARREYARSELAARLAAAGGARDEIEALLDDLVRRGYLSDARCAGAVVRQWAGTHARRAIAHELRERGVAPEAAAAALAGLEGRDEFAQAKALWQRRFGAPPADERAKGRQLRFLVTRGFAPAVAYRVLKNAGASVDEPDSPS